MTSYIDLDSMWRDREAYPNENDYVIGPNQIESWYRMNRIVRALPQNPNSLPLGFATSISLVSLTLPYSVDLVKMPRVYVNFTSKLYRDLHLVQAIDGRQAESKFVCHFDKIQNDSLGVPTWIHYKCDMDQVMRFEKKDPVIFQIFTRSGNILTQQDDNIPLPGNPDKQSLCTFSLTPYLQDGRFDNHMVETLN